MAPSLRLTGNGRVPLPRTVLRAISALMLRCVTLLLIVLVGVSTSPAHPEIDEALARLAAALVSSPNDASLYLERGELYAKHEDWTSAEANYVTAAELDPRLTGLALARGALALARGNPSEARSFLDKATSSDPANPTAFILRARAFARLNLRDAALTDYASAFHLITSPSPELYLERATLFASTAEAIRSLDEGITRLGSILSLHLRALELEISLGRTEDALSRIDLLTSTSERRELWLKRRGDILTSAGRRSEAKQAYEAALLAIASLPAWLANSPDTTRLSTELIRLATTPP